ncbi:SMI1/KNR4 family protein [Myxococcus sp. CA040A]|uniref:SMI1/KNR4 family protein n=1 Tax=Myxococcus sp. CA040A TaxID=2741738 RepID=UPI00157AF08D|nr:SMI1/KNR4 family protein [Myxococcus sp. CA040A]NTX05820.1 hypothetical protein [Myxococcus sp. CA040A]
MTDEELRKVIEATLDAQGKNATFRSTRRPDAVMAPPAPLVEVAEFKKVLAKDGLTPPPSLLQLLGVCNGVRDYMQNQDISLRSVKEMLSQRPEDLSWWDDFAPVHELVFASGDTNAFVGFDRLRADSRGEMPVVMVTPRGERFEYRDLEDFLRAQLRIQTNALAVNQEDRAHLADD